MTNIPIFIDLQGFKVGGKFIVKEVAILTDDCAISHYIFCAPMDWNLLTDREKSAACWLTTNHHSFHWTDGYIDYSHARRLIQGAVHKNLGSEIGVIYVKGLEKVRWLWTIIGKNDEEIRIEDIDANYEDVGRLEMLSTTPEIRCAYHSKNCALNNVWRLYQWWRNRESGLDMVD